MTEVTTARSTEHAPDTTSDLRAGIGDVLLDVRGLRTYFHLLDGVVKAVDGVDFSVRWGERVALVGESGCGKSVSALSIMRLIDIPPGEIAGGEVWFDGRNLLQLKDSEIRQVRGGDIALIFQEPMTSLNPVFTVGNQITEAIRLHQTKDDKQVKAIAIEALEAVGIPDPERRLQQYAHELSGGMRQRVMIAMALSCKPKLLIADEPTTALDVTIQRQILELIKDIQEKTGTALLLITHDLGVVAETADRVAVMYAGRIVEQGTVEEVLLRPRHPYTKGLLSSIPSQGKKGKRLSAIKGVVPNPFRMPPGCKFEPRCPYAWDVCRSAEPELFELAHGRASRCWVYDRRYWSHLEAYEAVDEIAGAAP